jgi:hypothetical protein
MRTRVLAACLLLAASSAAQLCPQDDGFAGPCCAAPAPVFPAFPVMTTLGKGGSLINCNPNCVWNTTTTIAPVQILCDYWLFNVSIIGGAPADPSIPGGFMLGKYARTWTETGPFGPIQVWRFLVNMDAAYVFPTAIIPGFCQYPFSVLPPFNLPAHYYGHLDYAYTCTTGAWEISYAMTHLCQHEAHAPFSAQPLPIPATLPNRTYHFVAPANFVFGDCPAPQGVILGDSQRSSTLFPVYQCQTENQIVQGSLNTAFQTCECAGATPVVPPSIYEHQNLFATVVGCGVAQPVTQIPIPGILPTGLRFQAIGSWVGAAGGIATYPGPECVGTYLGVLAFTDICSTPTPAPFHIALGTGTTGGYPMIPFNNPLGLAFTQAVDLANVLLLPTFAPGIGALYASDRVWSFNLP